MKTDEWVGEAIVVLDMFRLTLQMSRTVSSADFVTAEIASVPVLVF